MKVHQITSSLSRSMEIIEGFYTRPQPSPSQSMPLLSSRSPYRTQGDARCQHCGVFVWEKDLQMKHGVWYHKKCGYRVRLKPFPCTLERLKREHPKKHFGTTREREEER